MASCFFPTSPPPVRVPHYNRVRVQGLRFTILNAPVPEGEALQKRLQLIKHLYHKHMRKDAKSPVVRALSEEYFFLKQWKENPPQLFTSGCKNKVKSD